MGRAPAPNDVAHRAAMSELADRYFAAQCRRLGSIDGAPAPRRRAAKAEKPAGAAKRHPLDRFARRT